MMKTLGTLLIFMVVMVIASPVMAGTLNVDCGKGETVAQALESAKPGDTIQIMGTCKEIVTITTDDLTLDGQGSAVLDGGEGFKAGNVFKGVIEIDGARRVTLKGLTVQNGPDGILCINGATCNLQNITAQDNGDEGIQVSLNSTADLTDCTIQRSGEWGLVVNANSSVRISGSLVSNDNGRTGIGVFNASSMNAYAEVTIQANNNKRRGLNIGGGSSFSIGRHGGTVTLENNKGHGLLLWNGASMFAARGTLNASKNGKHGVVVASNSSLLSIRMNFQMQENKRAGLRVINGGTVNLKKATITDNKTDLSLSFGGRATLKGNTIGTITCETGALIRGDVKCPE